MRSFFGGLREVSTHVALHKVGPSEASPNEARPAASLALVRAAALVKAGLDRRPPTTVS